MQYRASLDTTAKLITGFTLALLAFISYRNWFIFAVPLWLKILISVLFLALIIVSWIYAPQNYVLSNDNLIINRPVNKITVPYSQITQIREISKAELGTLIRVWGSGGFFGFYGRFRSTRMGRMQLYTTSRKNLVLLVTDNGDQILLSPDDLSLVNHIKERMAARNIE